MSKKTGLKRNIIDKYYTKKNIVEKCVKLLKKNININYNNDIIIEPSAGNGSFIESLKKICKNHEFYDICPDNEFIKKQDYLELNLDKFNKFNKIHIIGNPPFGRQSTTAKKFIKKSCQNCDTISFILPKSFKKDSFKRTFPLSFHLIKEFDLPEKSFTVDNIDHDVPCIFQIWQRKSEKREVPKKLFPTYYKFVKKNENPDLSFRRIGVYAGKISKEIDNKSPQSHYFIKFNNNIKINEFIEKYKKIKFNEDNTVGPKSISKQELIAKINIY